MPTWPDSGEVRVSGPTRRRNPKYFHNAEADGMFGSQPLKIREVSRIAPVADRRMRADAADAWCWITKVITLMQRAQDAGFRGALSPQRGTISGSVGSIEPSIPTRPIFLNSQSRLHFSGSPAERSRNSASKVAPPLGNSAPQSFTRSQTWKPGPWNARLSAQATGIWCQRALTRP